ncbi:MAG: hypothetical protein HY786_02145 [Deltaproteobacteria bacterium]|nr:hypothetical protein [Deltaproteobacteria bacterium]
MANIRPDRIFKGFRAKVFWFLTTLLLALSIFLTVVVIYQQGKLLKQDMAARGLSIVGNFAHDSQLGIFTESSEFLEPVVKRNVGLEKDFVYAVVYNLEGKVIAVQTNEKGFIPDITRDLIKRLDEKPVSFWQETAYNKTEIYEFWAPVLVSKGFKGEDLVIDT